MEPSVPLPLEQNEAPIGGGESISQSEVYKTKEEGGRGSGLLMGEATRNDSWPALPKENRLGLTLSGVKG